MSTIDERILTKCNKMWCTKYTSPEQMHDELDRDYYDGCVEAAEEERDIMIDRACELAKTYLLVSTPETVAEARLQKFRNALKKL